MRVRPYLGEPTSIVAIALFLATPPGCRDVGGELANDSAPLSPELAHFLTDSAAIVAGLDTAEANGMLTHVRHGRVLPGRNGVILADRAEPFLRVFDLTGRLITTALPKGDGPREARSVSGLAVSDVGDVLVLTGLTGNGLMEYSFEGDSLRFLGQQQSPADIPMFIVASRCGHGWAAYTTRHLRSPARIPVLAVSDSDPAEGLIWRNAFSWATQTQNLGWGGLLRMVSDEQHVYVWHKYSLGSPILAIPCEEGVDSAKVLRETEEVPSSEQLQSVDSKGSAALVVTYPDTLYTGFAVLRGILFESETVAVAPDDRSREYFTIFSVTESGSRASVRVPGEWGILDGEGDRLLLIGEHGTTLNPIALLLPIGAVQRAVSGGLSPSEGG